MTTLRRLVFVAASISLLTGITGMTIGSSMEARQLARVTGGELFGDCELTGVTCQTQVGACVKAGDECVTCKFPDVKEEECEGWIGLCWETDTLACGWEITGAVCMPVPPAGLRCAGGVEQNHQCPEIQLCAGT